jgi:hypothetical protein
MVRRKDLNCGRTDYVRSVGRSDGIWAIVTGGLLGSDTGWWSCSDRLSFILTLPAFG